MSNKYSYLKPYFRHNIAHEDEGVRNIFYPIYRREIDEYETKLGFSFPSQLKEFWLEIGYGFLTTPHDKPLNYTFRPVNRINSPDMIGDIILEGVESEMISGDYLELVTPGDIAFFEISDSNDFLFMKPLSDNPNAVWALGNIKIEDSLERFIWRLYYESPEYFNDLIFSHYNL